ncbi:hypothetical protein AWC03_11380 [Mycobacterium europaeum]|nr:hypothetical protein AWC03_11380 [Mycobacterium europaeum]
MSSIASCAPAMSPAERLDVLFEELAELAGQRNAIDGRIVEIVAELERDELCGSTGARSVPALVAWKLGLSSANAHTITDVARRLEAFPRCAQGLREGRLSLDQVGVIAARAGEGSDEHYAELARVATVNQLRTAVKLEPRPEPDSRPEARPSITKTSSDEFSCWRIKLAHVDAAKFDAALASHRDALIAEWKHDRGNGDIQQSSHRRCRAPSRRFCAWSRPDGTPKRPAAPTASTPPWWYTSTSSGAPRRCIWVRCSPRPNAAT